eukprot:6200722-Pleurochrysis_carterae.AAC.8
MSVSKRNIVLETSLAGAEHDLGPQVDFALHARTVAWTQGQERSATRVGMDGIASQSIYQLYQLRASVDVRKQARERRKLRGATGRGGGAPLEW